MSYYPFDRPQNPLLDAKDFVRRCERFGLRISLDELSHYIDVGIITPIEKQNDGNLYSTFQLYCIDKARVYKQFRINRATTQIEVSNIQVYEHEGNAFRRVTLNMDTKLDLPESIKDKVLRNPEGFDDFFVARANGSEALKTIASEKKDFDIFLAFILKVEDVYFPYFRSGGGTMQISGDTKRWQERAQKLDIKQALKESDLEPERLAFWYKRLAEEAEDILGGSDDWLQLWKNISWSKKEKLKGELGKGVEYLQWALMVKRILKDYLQREILDVDEMGMIAAEDVLSFDPSSMDQRGMFLRASRNNFYSDGTKSYYDDRYKRLHYMANAFGINYQPKVMVFVEGQTEEHILPIIFRDMFGPPENRGIEFRNLMGITEFFGTFVKLKQPNNSYDKKIIGNFSSMISYNLDKWQIIPFLIGDNENDILTLLTTGNCIHFEGSKYPLPKGWYAIWGQYGSGPETGKDFELSNFTNTELVRAIRECDGNINIKEADIEAIRASGDKGLKQLPSPTGKAVDALKVKLAERLYGNLKQQFELTSDQSLFDRPVFQVLHQVAQIAVLNHAPTMTLDEKGNREVIRDILKGLRDAW